jgi:hypothetical protein
MQEALQSVTAAVARVYMRNGGGEQVLDLRDVVLRAGQLAPAKAACREDRLGLILVGALP